MTEKNIPKEVNKIGEGVFIVAVWGAASKAKALFPENELGFESIESLEF